MDSTPVNWEALDSLVIDFARSENLIEDPTLPPPPPVPAPPAMPLPPPPSTSLSSSYQCRLLIRQIRRSVESGDVDSAIELLLTHAPQVLEDHRLLFRLQKQKFIELLRIGTDEAREAAINCLRGAVAPVALDAYPEAYEEFKHILLALIFNKDDKSSPVANEWSEARRLEIAGLLSSILTAHLHAYDPIFAMTLRYLISIHKVFCFRQGIPSPISDLTQRLLFEDRDPPATPNESLYEAPPFDEVDIQALAHAVELTRQGAVDSLRFARGNLFEAFQNELCRMKMDVAVLDDLIHEYCVYRGIVENTHMVSSESGTTRLQEGEFSVHDVIKGAHAVDIISNHINGSEQRFSHDIASNLEDCSTSETNQSDNNCRRFRKGRIHAAVHCNRRKRWKGRAIDVTRDVASQWSNRSEVAHVAPGGLSIMDEEQNPSVAFSKEIYDHKYEVILEMRELASKGMTTEVVEEINVIDPGFFTQYPTLLFQLKQVEFLKLVSDGDYTRAIKVASSYLGPLTTNNPDLFKPLKETLFALLRPNEDALNRGTPLSILATSLQVALGGKLDVEEPKLMKIMRATLHTHSEWFKLQMCNDRFEGLLNIDSLKEIGIPKLSDVGSKVLSDHCTCGPVPVSISCSGASGTVPDGINTVSDFAGDVVCDEHAILKVMEFLALPRADAIHLLAQYNGNAEAVIQQIFA